MGIFTSCCKPSAADVPTPDAETRRRQQVEAAERRAAQERARGVRDSARLKRDQEEERNREDYMAQRERELAQAGGANLKWSAN